MCVALQGSNLGASSTQQAAAMPGQNAYGRCTRHEPAPARPAQSGVSCLPEMVMSSDYAAARRDYRFRYSGLREAGARLSTDRILMSSLVAQTSSSSSFSLETPVSISMPALSPAMPACTAQDKHERLRLYSHTLSRIPIVVSWLAAGFQLRRSEHTDVCALSIGVGKSCLLLRFCDDAWTPSFITCVLSAV